MYLVPLTNRRNTLALRNFFNIPLDDLFRAVPTDSQPVWGFDAHQDEKEVVVRAELPGFEPDELHVEVHEDVLTVKAEKKEKAEGQQSYRSFARRVSLPTGVETDKAQATYRNGVLELHLPKVEKPQPRRIQVQTASDVKLEASADAQPVAQQNAV